MGLIYKYQQGGSITKKMIDDKKLNYTPPKEKNKNSESTSVSNKKVPSIEQLKREKFEKDNALYMNFKEQPIINKGKKLTEQEQATSDKINKRLESKAKWKNTIIGDLGIDPTDIGMTAGNIASKLTRLTPLSQDEIIKVTNNPKETALLSSGLLTNALANEMGGALINKGVIKLIPHVSRSIDKQLVSLNEIKFKDIYKSNPFSIDEKKLLKKAEEMGVSEPELIYHGSPSKNLNLNSKEYIGKRTYDRDKVGTFFSNSVDHVDEFRFHHNQTPKDVINKVNHYMEYQTFKNSPPDMQESMIKHGYKPNYEIIREGQKLYKNYGETYTAITDKSKLKLQKGVIPETPNTVGTNVQDGLTPADVFLLDTKNFVQINKPHWLKGYQKNSLDKLIPKKNEVESLIKEIEAAKPIATEYKINDPNINKNNGIIDKPKDPNYLNNFGLRFVDDTKFKIDELKILAEQGKQHKITSKNFPNKKDIFMDELHMNAAKEEVEDILNAFSYNDIGPTLKSILERENITLQQAKKRLLENRNNKLFMSGEEHRIDMSQNIKLPQSLIKEDVSKVYYPNANYDSPWQKSVRKVPTQVGDKTDIVNKADLKDMDAFLRENYGHLIKLNRKGGLIYKK